MPLLVALDAVSRPKIALTIAGFDPSSGAGVTADLAVFQAARCFGISCVTALTVQSTLGVRSVNPVAAQTIAATLACLEEDLPPDGVKIGMLGNAPSVAAVVAFLAGLRRPVPIVLDPVLRSSSGRELLDAGGMALLREELLPLVSWVTPNVQELGILTGSAVDSRNAVEEAARRLQGKFSGLTVLATGGHLEPPDDLLLQPGGHSTWLPGVRIDSRSTHGTGCALSSAVLARLMQGMGPVEAAREAKAYVAEAIRRAPDVGGGKGPMGLLWPLHG